MKNYTLVALFTVAIMATGCKKEGCTDPTASNYSEKAKKDDGSCTYAPKYNVPSTYTFTRNANSTVDFSGQTDRLNQLREMISYAETGTTSTLDVQVLKAMFANTNGNGNGSFSFTSLRQLKNKCFSLDTAFITTLFEELALASQSYGQAATSSQAGVLSSGAFTYLFASNGIEYTEFVEKAIMGAVFEYQALNVYFGETNMSVDNTTAVDPANGSYYTQLEHHWDEAFGYFGVPLDFPTTVATDFWGKYCNSQNPTLNSNSYMINNFLTGRAAISSNHLEDRAQIIKNIREMWEKIAAYQAMRYLDLASGYFGTDQAKYLHVMSEALGFIYSLRFAPVETRKMNPTQVQDLMNQFGNLWTMSLSDIQTIKATLDNTY